MDVLHRERIIGSKEWISYRPKEAPNKIGKQNHESNNSLRLTHQAINLTIAAAR